jgi:transcriptional regulator with XRE-family HTH domain
VSELRKTDSRSQVDMGKRVRSARLDTGFSQLELANQTSISRVAVSEIEAGRRKVSSFELAALARALDRPTEYFLGILNHPEETFGGSTGGSTTVVHLARAARQLGPEDQEQLLRFAQYLRTEARRRPSGST